jgi:hypothetical protein
VNDKRPDPSLPRRRLLAWPVAACLGGVAAWGVVPARAQGVDLVTLELQRQDGWLTLDFSTRLQFPRGVQDALERGIPVYFVAEAVVLRSRWYWRDERVARVSRTWRLAFQPLTSTWRVGIGALGQSFATLAEAIGAVSRLSGWSLVELATLDADARHYVEFSFRLDTSQLPGPMQIGLTSQGDWQLRVERTLKLE